MKQADIAKLARVGRSTVSRVINNDPEVNEDTRQRILKIIKQTGYRPHASARSLASAKTHNIGIFIYDTNYIGIPYFGNVLSGILEVANSKGYNLTITTTQYNSKIKDSNIMKPIIEKRIDGAIIYDDVIEDNILIKLQEMKFPFVLVNRRVESNDSISSVSSDYHKGIEMIIRHLMELGHRRIGIQLADSRWHMEKEKLESYKNIIDQLNIEFDENLIVDAHMLNLIPSCENAVVSKYCIDYFMSLDIPPTALMFHSEEVASMAMKIALDKGYAVPKDLSIVSYNHIPDTITTRPGLTSVILNNKVIGIEAARMLLNMIHDNEYKPKNMIIQPELIVRESTGSAP